jgi:protein-S-isoprenylcysteine O-methyltransferase Ste14
MALAELQRPTTTAGHTRAVIAPPLVFAAAIAAGIVLDLFIPVDLLPAAVQLCTGSALIGFAVFLSAVSFRSFIKNRTTSGHRKDTLMLITDGPFRYTRNPLYLSGLLLVFGFGLLLDSVWIVALTAPAMVIVHFTAVLREEDYLLSRFGPKYEHYRSSVRRWI